MNPPGVIARRPGPVSEPLELSLEEPKIPGLVGHAEPARFGSPVVDRLHRLRHDVHVCLGVHPPRNGEPSQLELRVVMVSRVRVPAGAHDPPFHGPYPRIEVQLRRQGLGRELVLGDVGVEGSRVQEHGMAPDRLDDRDLPVGEELAEIVHLAHPGTDVVVLQALLDPDRHGFHVPPRHAAVRVQSLVDDDQVPQLLEEGPVVHREPAPDVDEVVLLATHPGAIGMGAELPHDLRDGSAGVPGLALLDEVGVLRHPGGVEKDPDSMAVAERPERLDVLHRHRLPTGHVHRSGQADVGDSIRTLAEDQGLQLAEIHIALEGMTTGRIVRRIDDDVHEGAAGQFLMQSGRGEIHVSGHELARLDGAAAEEMLRAPSLMGGQDVGVAVMTADRLLQPVEVPAACVGLVAEHHARPLAVAHGAGAAVGEEVDVDVG